MLIILGLHCKYLLLVQFMVEIFYRKKMGMVTLKQIENFLPKNDILRRSNSKKKIFVCFNGMQFIFGQVVGHGTTNIKISFSNLPLPWLPC